MQHDPPELTFSPLVKLLIFFFSVAQTLLSVSFKYSVAASDNPGWKQSISLLVTAQIAAWKWQPEVEASVLCLITFKLLLLFLFVNPYILPFPLFFFFFFS